jgi:hypothetical protein
LNDLYNWTGKTTTTLRNAAGVHRVVELWGHEWDAMKRDNKSIKDYVTSKCLSPEPLKPRNAFDGGRVNGIRFQHTAREGEKIRYADITSLYPTVNKYDPYPSGHPNILVGGEITDPLTQYFGMVKCVMLPPQDLDPPVLPYHSNGKLTFPLCAKCADTMQQTPCQHSSCERALHGTWCTMEIKKAIQLGYEVISAQEVWHFPNPKQYDRSTKTGGLFAEYVNCFLKIKTEASGWPPGVVTEEQQDRYISDFFDCEGILLEKAKIKKNPGLRALAKLMLNSFWGKFGQKPNMTKTVITGDTATYFKMLSDISLNIKDINFIGEEKVAISYTIEEEFLQPSRITNVVIAAMTTSHARLRLYDALENIGADRLLYFDTDSVIYTVRPGEWEPEYNSFLGGFTDELDGDTISRFLCGGPKNYGYELAGSGKQHIKCKGITINPQTEKIANFDTLSGFIDGTGPEEVQVVNPFKISRKDNLLYTKSETKRWRSVYNKRKICDDGINTRPFGWKM